MVAGRRAPLLGEDTERSEPTRRAQDAPAAASVTTTRAARPPATPVLSALGKPLPLAGVRVFDFSWFLASAGGTRFLAAMGAEVIKVEWTATPTPAPAAMAPVGGRAAREAATGPLPGVTDPDMGGQFNNKNAGKRGMSLNVRHPEGLEIARRLIAISDVVAEGFSPGVMDRWGLGYEALRELKPDIIYAQQSGMGSSGRYGRFRAIGPIAASLAGITDMSGLPEPALPAGWGYSYLDWIGAYSFALAIAGRALPPRPDRRGPVDRRLPDRDGHLHLRCPVARLLGERHGSGRGRQPLAVEARSAARRLPRAPPRTAGSPSPASTEEEWQALCVAGHRSGPRTSGFAPSRIDWPPGRARGGRFVLDQRPGSLRADGATCRQRASRPVSARPAGTRSTPTRSSPISSG